MQYLTNHSNSRAGTLDIIRTEERKHWLRGLRQAELAVREKKKALQTNQWAQKKAERKINLALECLSYLRPLSSFCRRAPVVGTWLFNYAMDLSDTIAEYQESFLEQQSLFRDCEIELNAAVQERDRIVQEHPETQSLSFAEIEEQYGAIALLDQKVNYLAPRLLAFERGIPIEVGVALFDSSDDERQYLLERLMVARTNLEITEESVILLNQIASTSPEKQQRILALIEEEGVE